MRYIVLAREDLTNHVEGRALRTKTTYNVCKFLLEEVISRFGYVEKIVEDRGEFLPFALWADRMTYTRSTGFMPAELMYCQKPIFPIQSQIISWTTLPWNNEMTREDLISVRIMQLNIGNKMIEEAVQKIKNSRLKNKIYFDKKHRLRPFYDSTFDTQYDARRKLIKRWSGPYVVVTAFENGTFKLREFDGSFLKNLIARKRVKLFKKRNNEEYEIEEIDDDDDDADENEDDD
ncbi:hypothetical protein KP509_10G088200 [Ceratopteris richardii]|uniref:Uncharacterized protein n=1 Tax=Ceratopteris richardii TaxID=49495 RepID=A0A8T2TX78_CERRI|nr:hypothetical protein KP509_10G088200 [Ceratopteris richardii]